MARSAQIRSTSFFALALAAHDVHRERCMRASWTMGAWVALSFAALACSIDGAGHADRCDDGDACPDGRACYRGFCIVQEGATANDPSKPGGDPRDGTDPWRDAGSSDMDAGLPTDDAEPTDDSQPTDDGQPVDDSQPTDDGQPVDDSQPTDDGQPVDDSQPTDDGQPVDDSEPVDDAQPVDDSEPVDDSQPVDDSEPVDDADGDPGPQPGEVGSPCDNPNDCDGHSCFRESGVGYCTAVCNSEGSISGCPGGSVCKRIHGGPRRCLRICAVGLSCPTGSACVSVPGSSFMGCEPLP
jgi:hypothetical protein